MTERPGDECAAHDPVSVVVEQARGWPAPVPGDAFGRVLQRCWNGGGGPGLSYEVAERDDGMVSVSDASRYFGDPSTWVATERWAVEQARGRAVDIGCGAGRHALALQERGYEVLGTDPSPGAVAVSCARGVDARRGTVLAPPSGVGLFDTLLLAGSNIGLLGSRRRAPAVLAALADLAAPGAQMLACGIEPYATDDEDHLAYHDRNRARGRMPGQVTLRVRDGRVATSFFDYLFVSADELRDLVGGSTWRLASFDVDGPFCVARLVADGAAQ